MDFLIARDDLHEIRFEQTPPAEPGPGEALLAVSSVRPDLQQHHLRDVWRADVLLGLLPGRRGMGPDARLGLCRRQRQPCAGPSCRRPRVRLPAALRATLLSRRTRVSDRGFSRREPPPRRAARRLQRLHAHRRRPDLRRRSTRTQQMLLRPLFFTSWLIDDFLHDSEFFGATTSCSRAPRARPRARLAYLLSRREGIDVVGLTSARSADFTRGLGVYDHVITYDELDALPQGRAVYVDMAGDARVRQAVHGHYGERARALGCGRRDPPRPDGRGPRLRCPAPRPTFFFAPDRVAKRGGDWGRAGPRTPRIADAWHPYVELGRRLAQGDPRPGARRRPRRLPGPARRAHRPVERPRPHAVGRAESRRRRP